MLQGACLGMLLTACGGGGGGSSGPSSVSPTSSLIIASDPTTQYLTSADVQKIVAQAEQAAIAKGASQALIAVVDRVGNVLVVYKIGSSFTVQIASGRSLSSSPQGLDGLSGIGPELAAIAKAVTGAYLSSSGNAFSTRTASYIIQEHFPPTISNMAAGPLFGVQFSQLPCGDLVSNNATNSSTTGFGPHRSPLGLAADPGGFPLYKNGVVVGGVGVMTNHNYSLDIDPINAVTTTTDEIIAQSAATGYTPDSSIRADTISLGGVYPTYTNADASLVRVSSTTPSTGALLSVSGYYAASGYLQGQAYGASSSGYVAVNSSAYPGFSSGTFPAGTYMLTSGSSNNRYAPTASTSPAVNGTSGGLTSSEVNQILVSALAVVNQTRAQIRHPLNSAAQVTVSVVDASGNILGVMRAADAPIFGTDVSLQKARTAAFFSASASNNGYSASSAIGSMSNPQYASSASPVTLSSTTITMSNYITASSSFGSSGLDGTYAFSTRSLAAISRPFYPDGIQANGNGPLSKSYSAWSVFSTGFQLDAVYSKLVTAILAPTTVLGNCMSGTGTGVSAMANGPQIFAGGTPIYRGNLLIGGIGTSGDGTSQDDMISYLGVTNAASVSGTGFSTAPSSKRADQLNPQGDGNLRFVSCPNAPFLNSDQQSVCN